MPTVNNMKAIRMMVLSILLTTHVMAWGNFDEGLEAYHHGHYETALREWKPLAEQGDIGDVHPI